MLIYSDFSSFQSLVDLDDPDRTGEDCVRDGLDRI